MQEYYDSVKRQKIRVYDSNEVELPKDTDTVQVVYYIAVKEIQIIKQSRYSKKLTWCNDVDNLVKSLTETKKHSTRKRTKKAANKCKKQNDKTADEHKKACNYSDNSDLPDDVEYEDGYIYMTETGEIIGEYRTEHSLYRSYKRQVELMKNNCICGKSVFCTFTVDTYPDYDDIKRLAQNFQKQLKRKFKGRLACAFIFQEPCDLGHWHLHMIITFYTKITQNDYDVMTEWWDKQNKKHCVNQTVIKEIETKQNLLSVIQYLDPTREGKRIG